MMEVSLFLIGLLHIDHMHLPQPSSLLLYG